MSGLFDRWLGSHAAMPIPQMPQPVGLQVWLNDHGQVLRLSGPLRTLLAVPGQPPTQVHDYLLRHSWVVLEGTPADWQGQPLDLDFRTVLGHPLHTRGWLQRQADGWMLQLFDIGDLLRAGDTQDHCQAQRQLAAGIGQALRDCSAERLAQTTSEQLQRLATHWQAGSVRLMLASGSGWRTHACSNSTWPWANDERLHPWLQALPASFQQVAAESMQLQAQGAGLSMFVLPYSHGHEVQAWLLCAGAPAVPAPEPATALLLALAEPLLTRLRQHQLQRRTQDLDALQQQLGAGRWEWPLQGPLRFDPALAASLGLDAEASIEQWLARLHPADREAAHMALEQLCDGVALNLNLRLLAPDNVAGPRWLHWVGQLQGSQAQGFLLDISALKAQELQAGAARARLENLIASSPAVIYIQRYAEGALHTEFFSASLTPMLGWPKDSDLARQPGQAVHPEDRALWLERTRSLLRDGHVRSRYRLRDHLGGYHWVLDEARLLRNDLGQPVEVVGLWLDVSEATEAAERVRQSEERYRVLVEDSPAMICRYRPDLTLLFGNQPLAEQLECTPQQLTEMNLGQWMSESQRLAFLQRLAALTPDQPLSSAEICLQLPGRQHAWWVWADRGLFDDQGKLLEVQAVGRDNTQVRHSQQQLLQGAKMATLGELATGLVHEINQPLNVMRLAVANTLKRLESGMADIEYLTSKLQRIDAQVERAARLVEHMRAYGRRSEVERQAFAAWVAVDGAVALLAEGLRGKGVALQIEEPDDCPEVLGHEDQLEQVLINLMVNARDALLERQVNRPLIQVSQRIEDGRLCLRVQDNAGGIDPRLLDRIFEPFFTTKPAGVGTGLGLSVSHGIVQAMGGRLEAMNNSDGACFQVVLPVYSIS
ncbi:PAS domain-containing protein [Pseudomonas putida]|nr:MULTISPECIES: ATP-binding protein [unclassified Pseudomonas]MBI6942364.1 PAS domain-containing protein [Pseudomonas putida]MBI6956491.1 PAS domain-containing protein [Pseudomonas putida]PZQ42245.1 MAG: PAS domain-containing sensor histidine kinase [Pseudomonas putida]